MQDYLGRLFSTDGFMPRWTCGEWTPFSGWLHIISDLLIFVAYAAIPLSIFILIRRWRDVAFPAVAWLFVAFNLSCGITHAVEASIFWWPAYRLSGLLKAVTAVVSLATAFALIRVLPQAIALPRIKKTNEQLADALAREQALSQQLACAQEELEKRNAMLAVREHRMRNAVGAAKACALSWDVESGSILWHLRFHEAMRSAGLNWTNDLHHWNELISQDYADDFRAAVVEAMQSQRVVHRRFDLRGHEGTWDIRMTATPDPPVTGQPATMSGMFGLVPSGDSRAG